MDWRVALRYMAQQLHRIACQMNLRNAREPVSPLKFELIVVARSLAGEVTLKRAQLLGEVERAASR